MENTKKQDGRKISSDLIDQAQIMYVTEEKTAVEIASILGVSAKTIGAWVKAENWKGLIKAGYEQSPEKLLSNFTEGSKIASGRKYETRAIAKQLYILKRKTFTEISQITGVSEKTLGLWARTEGWKIERQKSPGVYEPIWNVEDRFGSHTLIDADRLKEHVANQHPQYIKAVTESVDSFIIKNSN